MACSETIVLPELKVQETSAETGEGRLVVPGQSIGRKELSVDPVFISKCMGKARSASANAYAPYSKFQVGASVVMADDPEQQIFTGCNVENASYGLTVCAERACISAAVSAGFRTIRYLAVSTVSSLDMDLGNRMPCGACRQVIREFSGNQQQSNETLVFVDNGNPDILGEVFDVDRLLAHGFSLCTQGPHQ